MSKQKWSFVPCTGDTCGYIEDRGGDTLAHCLDDSKGPLMAEAPALLDACKGLASLAYSLMPPANLPQCYRDAVAIFDRLEGRK